MLEKDHIEEIIRISIGVVLFWIFMKRSQSEKKEWLQDFRAAKRRRLKDRLDYAFIRTFKPVLDESSFRSFDSMKTYRQWCENHLPGWLGYGRTL
jgi:hypothetical protein